MEGLAVTAAWRHPPPLLLQLKDIPTVVAAKGGLSKRAQVPDATALAALTQVSEERTPSSQ